MQAHRVDGQHVHGEVDALGRAGEGVVVAVAAQQGDPPVGDQFQRLGMQPGAGPGRVPRAELGLAQAVPDPDEQQVALAEVHLLRVGGRDHVVGGHVVTRLEPGCPAQPRDVQQHAAADDPVPGRLVGQLRRPGRPDGLRRHVVVEPGLVDDVAQRVDVAVGVPVNVHGQPVRGKGQPIRVGLVPGRAGHVVHGGVGIVGCHAALDRGGEAHRPA